MTGQAHRLFVFGLGYSGRVLARRLVELGWHVSGTHRPTEHEGAQWDPDDLECFPFDRVVPLSGDGLAALRAADHVLISIPPDGRGDPVLDMHGDDLAALAGTIRWLGYLSTTGVYGDTGGQLVDETAPRKATGVRGRRRVAAEDAWISLKARTGLPVHLFRLAGIYGPGRSTLDQVRAGRAKRIDKPGHKFGRIHVEDIATILQASMAKPDPGAAYNCVDDEATAPAEVVAYACELLGVDPPPLEPFETAAANMSAMALSFWDDNRQVDNTRIKTDLGVTLGYPNYRIGLKAALEEGG